jgi:hypothetical protein
MVVLRSYREWTRGWLTSGEATSGKCHERRNLRPLLRQRLRGFQPSEEHSEREAKDHGGQHPPASAKGGRRARKDLEDPDRQRWKVEEGAGKTNDPLPSTQPDTTTYQKVLNARHPQRSSQLYESRLIRKDGNPHLEIL